MANVILAGKQPVFVAMYVDNELLPVNERLPVYQVAINAGYAERAARNAASLLLANPNVAQAIEERKRALAEAAAGAEDVDAKRVIQEWATIAVGDPTEIVGVRHLNCRHCWGFNFGKQYTDAEYAKETAEALNDATFNGVPVDLSPFTGGPGFRKTKSPNPECPECDGEGIEDVYVKDFRKLSDKQRRLIAGVKTTRDGLEVKFRDQDGALAKLAQWLGLLVNKNEVSGPNGGPVPVAAVTYALPSDPQEASRAWQLLMEGKTV